MRRSLFIITALLVLFFTSGCLKDTPSTDLSNVGTIIEMMYPNGAQDFGVGTGLEFFSGDQITFSPLDASDTVTYYANIAGATTLNKPVTVNMAIDDSALEDNQANDGITYTPLPDSCYKLITSSGTIPAGQRIDTFQVVIYPDKIDLTQNYGAPVQLSAPGYTVAANFSIMYLHTIGAPIGGLYNQTTTIYGDSAGTGTPNILTLGPTGVFLPLDGTDIEVPTGDTTGISYVLTFTNTNGVASNFSVALDASTIPSHVSVIAGPTIVLADPVNKVYTLNFVVSMGSYDKNITDSFTWVANN
jgi:hypothetical protein